MDKLAGMLLGLLGLLIVFHGALAVDAAWGLIALFSAVVAQSLGLVWIKRVGDDSPPLATTLGSLLVALPLFILAWWWFDGRIPHALPVRAMSAIIYLGSVGSVLGFLLYYYLIKHMDTGRIALITLITPVLALVLGHRLNNEDILPQVWLGGSCIMSGLALHRWGYKLMLWRV